MSVLKDGFGMFLNMMKVCPQAKILLSLRKNSFFPSFIQVYTHSCGYKG